MSRILEYCRGKGGRWIKIVATDNPYGEIGISDILGCYHGLFVAIEVKQEGEDPSPLQRLFLKEVADAGGFSTTARNIEDVVKFMDDVDRRIPKGR